MGYGAGQEVGDAPVTDAPAGAVPPRTNPGSPSLQIAIVLPVESEGTKVGTVPERASADGPAIITLVPEDGVDSACAAEPLAAAAVLMVFLQSYCPFEDLDRQEQRNRALA